MGTMSVRSKTLWLTLEIANEDIYFFDRKRLEPKKLLCFIQFVVYSMRNPVVYRTAKKVVFC